ncbi:hypothetical protein JAAARDRAFT_210607 [Jaapia argillacea MUCL 33604]|uniref:Phytocyanin domain-containing protein n=1 Tax=Jaapia argillacea MUCL 33604 TaxID=933084 RepID=A0A067PQ57_9AGAM|nr:hypothetical protein JAAARDRAFT_210607 [Jaapia argillacea MUCL 33604]
MVLLFVALSSFFAQICTVFGQTTHTVLVGTSLDFYDPPTVSAQVNDTITFIFGAGLHGVTQTTFEAPCFAMPGGFSSGLIGPGTNLTASSFQWNLIVSNGSTPIWYFCPGTRPLSHCAAGMVGVINPPSNDMWSSYISAAKSVSGTPVPSTVPVLQGSGAYAVQTPTPVIISTQPTADPSAISALSSFFIPATSSATPSPSVTQSSSNKVAAGPIVGGVIGGVAVIGVIGVLSFFLWRAHRKSDPRRATPYQNQAPFDPRQMGENKGYIHNGNVYVPGTNYPTSTGQPPSRSAGHDGESVYSTAQPSLHYAPSHTQTQAPSSPQFGPTRIPAGFAPRPSSDYVVPPPGHAALPPGAAYPNVKEIATEIIQLLREEGLAPAGPPATTVAGSDPSTSTATHVGSSGFGPAEGVTSVSPPASTAGSSRSGEKPHPLPRIPGPRSTEGTTSDPSSQQHLAGFSPGRGHFLPSNSGS